MMKWTSDLQIEDWNGHERIGINFKIPVEEKGGPGEGGADPLLSKRLQ